MAINVLSLWNSFSSKPGGKWAFSRLLCIQAPYFASIRPTFEELGVGYCRVRITKHRAVLNHLGSIHAIAMCNMAELAGGTMTEVSIPRTHRWIPKGMTVEYLKKATTDLIAVAEPGVMGEWPDAGEFKVNVQVKDNQDVPVFKAVITMWISLKKAV
jgi:acyl-coenzyme A thioesterase PaaI-like protein